MNIGPLRVLAVQTVEIEGVPGGLRHVEIYTMGGLVTLLWHGPEQARDVVVCVGGAMGGLLGPGDACYHRLGCELGAEGRGVVRVSYRRPNDLDACTADTVAAALLAEREGAERFVTVGHSFGGAIALRVALAPSPVAEAVLGVCTLATQSAGCEEAPTYGRRPLLLVHGDRDEILPVFASEMVRELAGTGELVVLPGAGHLLREGDASERVYSLVRDFAVRAFA